MISPTKKGFHQNAFLYLTLGFIATLIGFFPTYFNELGKTDASHHFHGITGSLWLILLIVQPLLYWSGKMRYRKDQVTLRDLPGPFCPSAYFVVFQWWQSIADQLANLPV